MTIKEKVFSSNGYSISNGRILKKGLPIDGPEHGFFISPSLFNATKKIADDNILILSYNKNSFPENLSIKDILSFARSYAKLKEKSLIVTEDIANKYNITNFISGPVGCESKNSLTYPVTVDELREMSKLLQNKIVIRPMSSDKIYSCITFNNPLNNAIYDTAEINEIIIPEEVEMVINVDKMAVSEDSMDNIEIYLKSISKDGVYGNNYKNLEIESTTNSNVIICHILNEPIISFPKISKNSLSKEHITFDINSASFLFHPETLSNKEAFENIDNKLNIKIHIGGIPLLSNFFSSIQEENLEEKIKAIYALYKSSPTNKEKYSKELFENLKVVKKLVSEKPELFDDGFSFRHNNGKSLLKEDLRIDFEKKLDYCISQETPEIREKLKQDKNKRTIECSSFQF